MATPSLFRPPVRASSAKEVAKSGASYLPSCYISRNPLSASAAAEDDDEELEVELQIPTIDFSSLTSGNHGLRARIVRDLAWACEDWGFFLVVNHGVPAALRMAMMDASVGFFDLREEDKAEYEGRHVMDPIRCGTSFNSTVEDVRYWRDFFKVFVHPKFHSPSKPLAFREVCEDYARHTRQLAKELLNAIWEGLGVEKDYIEKAIGFDSCFQVVIGNLYPPCPEPELAWGLPAHSDHGLLTILMQNDTDGLQVMHHGKWVSVKPLPNSFLVNVGDHMEIVSNGRYKSVLHRAKVNRKSTRMSVVTAIGPSLDAVVAPAQMLIDSDKCPAAFRGIKYRDYLEHQQGNQLKGNSALDLVRL